ncbi:MAG: DNA-binding protein WhiA [Ruminococcaceae bacterium]|nr:DNA-binding protein WhiA [Oscillospiraceae bacterium]
MSFTTDVCEELVTLNTSKNCCKKALLCGLFFNAETVGEKCVRATFKNAHSAEYTAFLLESRYSAPSEIEETARAGRVYYTVTSECPSIFKLLCAIDSTDTRAPWELLDFKCGSCRASFLRGAFISTATLSDPKKSYYLEFSLQNEARINRLAHMLETTVGAPKRVARGKNTGLYYKSNGDVAGIVNYIGGTKASFDVANTWVERDIRNNENRATNCVARNISRAVDASQKHINAIEALKASGRFEALSEELKMTAELRLEYDSASLSELALLHEPPISKSGLNRRLAKILEAAEEI